MKKIPCLNKNGCVFFLLYISRDMGEVSDEECSFKAFVSEILTKQALNKNNAHNIKKDILQIKSTWGEGRERERPRVF